MKKCPYCAEEIQDEAIYCRFCNHDLVATIKEPPILEQVVINDSSVHDPVDETNSSVCNPALFGIAILKNARSNLNNGFWGLWILQIVLFGIVLFFGGLGSTSSDSGTPLFLGLSSIVSFIGILIFLMIRPFLCYRTFQVSKQLRYSQSGSFFVTLASFLSPFYTYLALLIYIYRKIKLAEKGKYVLPPEHDYNKATLSIKLLIFVPIAATTLIFILATIARYSPNYQTIPTVIPKSTLFPSSIATTIPMATTTILPKDVNIFDDFSSVNGSLFQSSKKVLANEFYINDGTYNIDLLYGDPNKWSYIYSGNSLIGDQKYIQYSFDVRVNNRQELKNPDAIRNYWENFKNANQTGNPIDIPIEYGFYLGSIKDKEFIAFSLVEWKGKIRFWRIHPFEIENIYREDIGGITGSIIKMNSARDYANYGAGIKVPEKETNIYDHLGNEFINIKILRKDKIINYYVNDILVNETNLDHFYFDTSYAKNGYQPTLTPSDRYLKLNEFGFVVMNYGLDPQIQFDNLEIKTIPE